jgi:hypothetical protein
MVTGYPKASALDPGSTAKSSTGWSTSAMDNAAPDDLDAGTRSGRPVRSPRMHDFYVLEITQAARSARRTWKLQVRNSPLAVCQRKMRATIQPAGLLRRLKLKRRPATWGHFTTGSLLSSAQAAIVHVIGDFFTYLR